MTAKGKTKQYTQQEITICANCYHKDVCGNKDYLTENACCNYKEAELVEELPVALGTKVSEIQTAFGMQVTPYTVRIKCVDFELRHIHLWNMRVFGTEKEALEKIFSEYGFYPKDKEAAEAVKENTNE